MSTRDDLPYIDDEPFCLATQTDGANWEVFMMTGDDVSLVTTLENCPQESAEWIVDALNQRHQAEQRVARCRARPLPYWGASVLSENEDGSECDTTALIAKLFDLAIASGIAIDGQWRDVVAEAHQFLTEHP